MNIAKTKTTRVISLILCVLTLISVLMSAPLRVRAFEGETIVIDGMVFGYHSSSNDLGLRYITNPELLPEELVIPSAIDGLPVVSISSKAFESTQTKPINIKSVVIPEGIGYLGMMTFMNCKKLESVTLPESLKEIAREAFYGCESLKTINLPDNLTKIGEYAFSDCSSLTGIDLPQNITSLGSSCFMNCSSIESVAIPKSCSYLGDRSFYGCTNLKTVDVDEDAQFSTYMYATFENCTSLQTISVPAKLSSIGYKAFKNCSSLHTVNFAPNEKLRTIEIEAFKDCENLESINIENAKNLETIDTEAFMNCKSLKAINFEKATKLKRIGSGAFYGCESLERVYIPDNIGGISDQTFYNCYSLKEVVLSKNNALSTVGEEAFKNCVSLTSFIFPKSIYRIGDRAFENCYYLSYVKLGRELNYLGEFAFVNCAMTEIVLPQYINAMGYYSVGFLADEEYVYWIPDFTIYGEYGTVAHIYADTFDINFKLKQPDLHSVTNKANGIEIIFWTLPRTQGKYRVYRKTAGTSWTALGDATVGSFMDTTAVAGTKYTYTVKFIGNDGTTSLYDKDGLSITRLKTPSVSKIEDTIDGAKITWGAVAGATKYRAYVKTPNGWKGLGDTSSTSIVHTDAVSGTTYTYTVKAFDSDGSESTHNSTGWSHKFIAVPKLDTPIIKNAEVTNSGIKLTWDKVAGAENYRVFIKNGSSWKGLSTVSGATTSYIDKTATAGNTYTYTIRCMDSNGNPVSDYDKEGFTVRCLETPQITGFENIDGGTVITWNEVEGAEKYRLYVKKDGSWKMLSDVEGTSYTHLDLVEGTEYTYTIRCITEDSKTLESGFDSTGFSNIYEKPEITVLIGDADLDGELSVMDASLIQMYLVGKKTIEGDALIAADADEDGEISVMDASLIQMILVGKK